jgi:hypothetical protein
MENWTVSNESSYNKKKENKFNYDDIKSFSSMSTNHKSPKQEASGYNSNFSSKLDGIGSLLGMKTVEKQRKSDFFNFNLDKRQQPVKTGGLFSSFKEPEINFTKKGDGRIMKEIDSFSYKSNLK